MAIKYTLPLRIFQGLIALTDLVLLAYVAHWWTGHWHDFSPSEINFLIFSSVWTFLTIAYLVVAPARFPVAAHKVGLLAAEALAMFFWFAGFIALGAFLGNRVCFGTVCNVARAAVAFSAVEWLLFAISTGLAVYQMVAARKAGNSVRNQKVEMSEGA